MTARKGGTPLRTGSTRLCRVAWGKRSRHPSLAGRVRRQRRSEGAAEVLRRFGGARCAPWARGGHGGAARVRSRPAYSCPYARVLKAWEAGESLTRLAQRLAQRALIPNLVWQQISQQQPSLREEFNRRRSVFTVTRISAATWRKARMTTVQDARRGRSGSFLILWGR